MPRSLKYGLEASLIREKKVSFSCPFLLILALKVLWPQCSLQAAARYSYSPSRKSRPSLWALPWMAFISARLRASLRSFDKAISWSSSKFRIGITSIGAGRPAITSVSGEAVLTCSTVLFTSSSPVIRLIVGSESVGENSYSVPDCMATGLIPKIEAA